MNKIYMLIILFGILGCTKESVDEGIEGAWAKCQEVTIRDGQGGNIDISEYYLFTYKGGKEFLKVTSHSAPGCNIENRQSAINITSLVSTGETLVSADNATEIDVEVVAASVIPYTEQSLVEIRENSSLVYELNIETDITSEASYIGWKRYDLILEVNNVMYFGDRTGDYDGTTSELRPVNMNYSTGYPRIN